MNAVRGTHGREIGDRNDVKEKQRNQNDHNQDNSKTTPQYPEPPHTMLTRVLPIPTGTTGLCCNRSIRTGGHRWVICGRCLIFVRFFFWKGTSLARVPWPRMVQCRICRLLPGPIWRGVLFLIFVSLPCLSDAI
jgi:hypothetical protein